MDLYTQMDILLLILYVFSALLFSFLCSVAEAALLSTTPTFIADLKEKHPRRAAMLKKLKQDNIDRSLAAILTLNTIAHTVGAIGAGAKAAVIFGNAYFGLFSAFMTLAILFISEIIPKTLGAVFWCSLSGFTAHFTQTLIYLLYPLIIISEQITKLIAKEKTGSAFSRDEFIAMTYIGEQAGHIKKDESRIIRNLFKLESLTAKDIMTPRTVIMSLEEKKTVSQVLTELEDPPFSRLPIYGKNQDDITGFILKDDILLSQAQDKGDIALKDLKREIKMVSENMSLSSLLEFMLNNRSQIALVVGDYGVEGLVTLEDVVETLLGMEIMDEADKIEDMQALARNLWEKRSKTIHLRSTR